MELRYIKAFSVSVLLWIFLFFSVSLALRGRSLFSDGGSKGSITLSLRLTEKGASDDASSLPADSTPAQSSFSEPQSQAVPQKPAVEKSGLMPVNEEYAADSAVAVSESVVSAAAKTEASLQKDASEIAADSAFSAAKDAFETEDSSLSGMHSSLSVESSGTAALLSRDDISAILQVEIEKRLVYPEIARQRGEQGSVTLLVSIAKDGASFDVQVIKSAGSILDKNAQKLVSSIIKKNRNRFAAGHAEPFSGEFTINYNLEH